MKYEEDKVDTVQASLVSDSGNMGGGVSRVTAAAFYGGNREVILAHVNPSPWKTRLEECNVPAGESPRVDGGGLDDSETPLITC